MARVTRSSVAKPVPAEPAQHLSSPPATPAPPKSQKVKAAASKVKLEKESPPKPLPIAPNTGRKRSRPTTVKDEDANELPHNLGAIPNLTSNTIKNEEGSPKKKPRANRKASKFISPKEDEDELVAKATDTPGKTPKKAKNSNYGLTPGQTPYPNWPHPTEEECEEVAQLLSTVHGEVKAPKSIPAPSLEVSGCGEVPSVLDALIRTRLSAATSGTNSSRAFAGLVAKFGILQEGVGKGSVDWNKVRLADTKDIFEAIKSGGLADVKSKDIKKILQMVWEENQARRDALAASSEVKGSSNESSHEKNSEITKADENVVSLDHLHLMSNDDAFNALTKYPGIGPKTASCVLLFCLQRPSFAVDTHVFRLCKWLGWVPPPGDPSGLPPSGKGTFAGPTRNSTYAHCEVRIPDHLKYPLHQLFIKHGKSCPRCRAITGENSEKWDEGCVIDHLVNRTGGRKGAGASPVKKGIKAAKGNSKRKTKDSDTDSEMSELSDLGTDNGEADSDLEV
ncbi:DNA glycosylase [Corynespora cassiicola Philippines]|uniref:DNA glycosylase n=1 Tax=Corynespora cassiicola Philippines TaxID=1448308 RepID=A0A2T2NUL0_CORCC|nr:DNA glycosylase [Corynespora cassiicola Philippines]